MTSHRQPARRSALSLLSMRAVVITAVAFLMVLSSKSHGLNTAAIDALAPVEVVSAGLREPTSVAIDPNGTVFVADRAAGAVYRVVAGVLGRVRTGLKAPVGIAFDAAGRLLVVEETLGRIVAIDGSATTIVARGMKHPRSIAIAGDGTIYASALGLERQAGTGEAILRVDVTGNVTVWIDGFKGLEALAVRDGAVLAVAAGRNREDAAVFEVEIEHDGSAGAVTRMNDAPFSAPVGLAQDALGAVYVSAKLLGARASATPNAIAKVAPDGTVTTFASRLEQPRGIVLDTAGNLYAADGTARSARLLKFLAPAPPTVTGTQFTSQTSVTVAGEAEPGARVDVVMDDAVVGSTVTEDGAFAVAATIAPNASNTVAVYATAEQGRGLTSAATTVSLLHDVVAPSISALVPANGVFRNTSQPAMSATFADAGAGVDVGSVSIRLDGVSVTAQAQVTATGFTLTPAALAEGAHTIAVQLADRAGNTASASSTFVVDLTPPSIAALQPANGSTVTVTRPTIGATFSDALAGVAVTSASILVDGVDRTGSATVGGTGFTLDPGDLAAGAHTWSVSVADFAGNVATAAASFTISTSPGSSLPPDPVTVAPPVDGSVPTSAFAATEFLYTGPNAIQTGVAPNAIEPSRVAVVRGRVLDRSGAPLSGVRVTVLNASVLGQTSSRADGMFDLAVNGGQTVTVAYELAGFLPLQRSIDVAAHQFGAVPAVVMVPYDTEVTPVDLTASTPIQVAQGTRVTDALGTRQPTLFFQQGTTATMRLPGGRQQALSTLSVRATEFTVGPSGLSALPGSLPANVAFVSSTEYTVDEAVAAGALEVRFNRPVINYVENIVGIPTGDAVPLASYDRERGTWVPEPDGVVIAILGVAGGLAQVDTDGDGLADSGTALGMTDAERQHLAALYQPGQTLTRRLLHHFTPFG